MADGYHQMMIDGMKLSELTHVMNVEPRTLDLSIDGIERQLPVTLTGGEEITVSRRNEGAEYQPLTIITGGQYGSEGKGSIINHMAQLYDHFGLRYPYQVRVGGPQAGHSVKLDNGTILKFKVVPVGALQEGVTALIGMTSVVNLEIMAEEIEMIREHMGFTPRVIVDHRATVWSPQDPLDELGENMITRIGSTAKGVGRARERRIARTAEVIGDQPEVVMWLGAEVGDTQHIIIDALDSHQGVMVEAAQGQLLSLYSGGHYPFATSSESGPTSAFADVGLPLRYARDVRSIGVFRTFPIRVAGKSGPLPNEIRWEDLQKLYGDHIPVERTTVTDKIRRVGWWDAAEVRKSVAFTGVTEAALTFVDYPFPGDAGVTIWGELSPQAKAYIDQKELELGIPITIIGTGFGTYITRGEG